MYFSHSLTTHYVYCVTNAKTGEFYIGVHSWNETGVDPRYFSSSARMQQSWLDDFDAWSVVVIDSEITTDRQASQTARNRLNDVETLLIAEHVDNKLCINRPASLRRGDGVNRAFRLARDIQRHERGNLKYGPEPRPGTTAWHKWDVMRRLGENLKAAPLN